MPLVEVPCPGCRAVLKAPDSMAGKKARCKRCNTPFRIPGGVADSVGDSQMLSAADPPPAARKPAPRPPAEEDIPAATAVDDEPLAATVAEDDEPLAATVAEEPPAPAAAGSLFAFSAAPAEPAKKRRRDEDEDDDRGDRRPAPGRKPAAGGPNKLVLVGVGAGVFALVAGGVVAAALVYMHSKPAEVAKNEKKDEKKLPDAAPPPEPPPAEKDATPPPKGKTGRGGKDAGGARGPGTAAAKGKGGMLALPQGKALAFPAKPTGAKVVAEPASNPVPVEVAFAEVRRFFPPAKAEGDVGVAWRSNAGFQGSGEKISLSLFSPNTGKELAKVESDGDGTPDPACDLSVDGGTFAIGNRLTGKVTVWDVRKKAKKLDAFDPYKDLPEHKAAKLAAVYLTEPPDKLVTVTTAGAVHVWDVGSKAAAGEFVPPKAAPGKVADRRGVAPFPNRRGVVVAVAGVVYKVSTFEGVAGSPAEDLGGDVGRSLALAVSPGGKLLYAFETDADGKKEKAVMMLAEGSRSLALRWPADAGEPVSAGWAGDNVATLATNQGAAVWFDADGGFNPLAIARTPDDKAAHAATESYWSLLPVAGNPKACVAVETALPPQGIGDPLTPANRRPVASLLLDQKGLSQAAAKE